MKDWHLLMALGALLLVEGFVFTVFEVLNFGVTPEYGHGEETNRENPVTINVSDDYTTKQSY